MSNKLQHRDYRKQEKTVTNDRKKEQTLTTVLTPYLIFKLSGGTKNKADYGPDLLPYA